MKPQLLKKEMCDTCPFRDGSPYAYLLHDLKHCALTKRSRVCHSTGKNNAINKRTGKPEALCRGARDAQLQMFHRLGLLSAPTDEAWNKQCISMGLEPNEHV